LQCSYNAIISLIIIKTSCRFTSYFFAEIFYRNVAHIQNISSIYPKTICLHGQVK